MSTSVSNFNFLALLVTVFTEIWRGSQSKKWALLISQDAPLRTNFLHVATVPANAYQRTKFQLSSSISFGDMWWGVPK